MADDFGLDLSFFDDKIPSENSNSGFDFVDTKELIQLGAIDTSFFGKQFFPKTLRMGTPAFHRKIDAVLDSDRRLIGIKAFRGSAKTTKARVYGAKRIAYGLSRTILLIGKSEGHAIQSLRWLRKEIAYNKFFTQTFKLEPGDTWSDTHIQIRHHIEEHTVNVIALGMTGSVRGVNLEDYRPDLIICDDPLDEENTATEAQREKTEELLYGALKEGLAPRSESPDAKMIMLQTPMNIEDVSMKMDTDREWLSLTFPIWTPETMDAPVDEQQSVWEERFPSREVRQEKKDAAARNKLSTFTREKECRIISKETSSFRVEWLNFYDTEPDDMYKVMAIDPVPPPSEKEVKAGLKKKDHEVIAVIGKKGKDYFLLDYAMKQGHTPTWTIMEFFRLLRKWHTLRTVVESVAYQRTLAWLLRTAMDTQQVYTPIIEYDDRRKKSIRIVGALNGIASNGRLWVRREHTEFIQQFTEYPNVAHDDVLDAVSIAISEINAAIEGGDEESFEDLLKRERGDEKRLTYTRGAP